MYPKFGKPTVPRKAKMPAGAPKRMSIEEAQDPFRSPFHFPKRGKMHKRF